MLSEAGQASRPDWGRRVGPFSGHKSFPWQVSMPGGGRGGQEVSPEPAPSGPGLPPPPLKKTPDVPRPQQFARKPQFSICYSKKDKPSLPLPLPPQLSWPGEGEGLQHREGPAALPQLLGLSAHLLILRRECLALRDSPAPRRWRKRKWDILLPSFLLWRLRPHTPLQSSNCQAVAIFPQRNLSANPTTSLPLPTPSQPTLQPSFWGAPTPGGC